MEIEILERLVLEARRIAEKFHAVRWYAFGSWSRGEQDYEDIDVLIVYGDGIDSEEIRSELRDLCLSLPVDLYLFHEHEEQELSFIAGQHCQLVYPCLKQ
jgi:predicted nucleotidyltransferase